MMIPEGFAIIKLTI